MDQEALMKLSMDELVRLAIEEEDEDALAGYLELIHAHVPGEVFGKASGLCKSADAGERRIGAAILGSGGDGFVPFGYKALQIVTAMLKGETDPAVLKAVIISAADLQDEDEVLNLDTLLEYTRSAQPEIRQGAVKAMWELDDPRAVSRLLELTRDEDFRVRDWATFGIGYRPELDSPEIREALLERLDDDDEVTSCEALLGLAARKDARVYDIILDTIKDGEPGTIIFEAAEELGDKRLLEPLRKLLADSREDPDEEWLSWLKNAIEVLEKEGE